MGSDTFFFSRQECCANLFRGSNFKKMKTHSVAKWSLKWNHSVLIIMCSDLADYILPLLPHHSWKLQEWFEISTAYDTKPTECDAAPWKDGIVQNRFLSSRAKNIRSLHELSGSALKFWPKCSTLTRSPEANIWRIEILIAPRERALKIL